MLAMVEGLCISGKLLQGKETKNPEWSFVRIDANSRTYTILASKDKLNGQKPGDTVVAVVNARVEEYKGNHKIAFMLEQLN